MGIKKVHNARLKAQQSRIQPKGRSRPGGGPTTHRPKPSRSFDDFKPKKLPATNPLSNDRFEKAAKSHFERLNLAEQAKRKEQRKLLVATKRAAAKQGHMEPLVQSFRVGENHIWNYEQKEGERCCKIRVRFFTTAQMKSIKLIIHTGTSLRWRCYIHFSDINSISIVEKDDIARMAITTKIPVMFEKGRVGVNSTGDNDIIWKECQKLQWQNEQFNPNPNKHIIEFRPLAWKPDFYTKLAASDSRIEQMLLGLDPKIKSNKKWILGQKKSTNDSDGGPIEQNIKEGGHIKNTKAIVGRFQKNKDSTHRTTFDSKPKGTRATYAENKKTTLEHAQETSENKLGSRGIAMKKNRKDSNHTSNTMAEKTKPGQGDHNKLSVCGGDDHVNKNKAKEMSMTNNKHFDYSKRKVKIHNNGKKPNQNRYHATTNTNNTSNDEENKEKIDPTCDKPNQSNRYQKEYSKADNMVTSSRPNRLFGEKFGKARGPKSRLVKMIENNTNDNYMKSNKSKRSKS